MSITVHRPRGRCIVCDERRVLYPDMCSGCIDAENEAQDADEQSKRETYEALGLRMAELLDAVEAFQGAVGHQYCNEGRGCDHGLASCAFISRLIAELRDIP